MRTVLCILSLASAAMFPTIAQARQAASSAVMFESWSLRCQTTTEKGSAIKLCEVNTTVAVKTKDGRPAVVMVIAFSNSSADTSNQLVVNSPTDVWLSAGIKMQDKSGKPLLELPYMFCGPSMCTAAITITDPQWNALLAPGDDVYAFFHMRAGRDIKIKVSLNGLESAYKAMIKEILAK